MNNLLPLAVLALSSWTVLAARADTVTYTTSMGRKVTLTGTITEYTGDTLVVEQTGGIDSNIPAERVESYETSWPTDYDQGRVLQASGKLAEALTSHRKALRAESRRWAQRRILADVVRCYHDTGQYEQAVAMFLILVRDDPTTQYFDAIPLSWKTYRPGGTFRTRAEEWLTAHENSVAALLGASWLLASDKRSAALAVLNRLSTDADPRIAALARAQVWQTEIVTATPAIVARWENFVEQAPAVVRAGPYFVVGRGWSHCGQSEQAALALMRAPILHPAERTLSAEALVAAADELVKLDRPSEAIGLFREAITVHDGSEAAARAHTRLVELSAEKEK